MTDARFPDAGFLSSSSVAFGVGTFGVLLVTAIWLSCFAAFESLTGQTLGKRWMGLKVVSVDGGPAGLAAVSARTLLRLVDHLGLFLVGLLSMRFAGERRRRLGDLAGRTIVVRADTVAGVCPNPGLRAWIYPLLWTTTTMVVIFGFGQASSARASNRAVSLVRSYEKRPAERRRRARLLAAGPRPAARARRAGDRRLPPRDGGALPVLHPHHRLGRVSSSPVLPIGVLACGAGTNLQALIDRVHGREAEIVGVASDRPGAPALERASRAGIATAVFPLAAGEDRTSRDARMAAWLGERGARLIVLAGYMQLLGASFLERFPDAVINVHPSLLPAFPGLHAVEQALAYGARVFGVSVHFVDGGVDTGPLILQQAVSLEGDLSPADVLAALRPIEHALLPQAVRLFARGALSRDPANPRRIVIAGA